MKDWQQCDSMAIARELVGAELARRSDDRRLAESLVRKIEREKAKPRKKQAPIVNPTHVFSWIGDATVWMQLAVQLDQANRQVGAGIVDHHKLNVAHVATGFAFELACKCLLVSEYEPFRQTHSCRELHNALADDTRLALEDIMGASGWTDSRQCLTYVDERMSNADRKYWMINPERTFRSGKSVGPSFFIADGPMSIPQLGQVLFALLSLAEKKLRQARRGWDYRVRMQQPGDSRE